MSYPYLSTEARDAAIRDTARTLSRSGDPLGALISLNDIACNPARSEDYRDEALANASAVLAAYLHTLRTGADCAATDACYAVMKILSEGAPPLEEESLGCFRKRFLPGRAFRPAGTAGKNLRSNALPFDASQFHFDQAALNREILWSGEVCGKSASEMIQPYPYGPRHTLLLSDRAARHPQILGPELHEWAMAVVQSISLPGFVLAWNSLGDGGGSVNHSHFHCLTVACPFPVEDSHWRHLGGAREYPTTVVMFTPNQVAASDAFLQSLNKMGMAYNVLYSANTYFFPRSKAYRPGQGCGWWAVIEMAGLILCTNVDHYRALTSQNVTQEYAKLRV